MGYKIEVFSAAWCPSCTILKGNLKESNVNFEVVDCDTDEGMSKASELGVRGLPTTIIYDGDVVLRKIVGLQPTAEYTKYNSARVEVITDESCGNDGAALNG